MWARERLPALGSEGKHTPRRFAPGAHTLDGQTLVGSVGSQRVLTAPALKSGLCYATAPRARGCHASCWKNAGSTPTPGAIAFADSRSPSSQTRWGGA